ncbi:hypothetical protein BGY98DRAFT_1037016, partial [Russula aff. rugulosa BPL654]
MFVLIFLSPLVPLSIFFSYLVFSFTASRSTTRHPSSCGTRRDTRSIHIPSPLVASPLQLSFLLRLLTRLLGQHLPTQTPPCSSHTPPFLRITYY